ncbi:MAG: vitamin B12 dependent-methionine synthase activation domain-containing protein [Candidatus Kapaibacterium sp.]|jgi:5-methyltetrahydrofolate--homocysteine methyltransferase
MTTPHSMGITYFPSIDLNDLRPYIDWSPFFLSWELRGKYPAIFDDQHYGPEARKIFDDANNLLDDIIEHKSLHARGVCGLFPANSVNDDDIEVYADEERSTTLTTLNMLRQQSLKAEGQWNLCLADFIAPKESGIRDYIGAFAVSAGFGTEELCARYESLHDDYSSIMVKAVADRLAEAAAEWLHEKVRREIWAYAADEQFSNEDLINERYVGLRPAPGYPSCPDHTEKQKLFALIEAEKHTDIRLTENFAMYPAASVSGWYFSHPKAKYFPLGKIYKDQVISYAQRKGMSVEEIEKWLAPVLGYEP